MMDWSTIAFLIVLLKGLGVLATLIIFYVQLVRGRISMRTIGEGWWWGWWGF